MLIGWQGVGDGIALLIPKYMKDRPKQIDPVMAEPLEKESLTLKFILKRRLCPRNSESENNTEITAFISQEPHRSTL